MPQMVLPQTPAPGMQKDANATRPGSGREPNGESRYESVSRAEQERLDRQKTERRDEARAGDKHAAGAPGKAGKDRQSTASSEQAPHSKPEAPTRTEKAVAGKAETSESAEAVSDMDVTSTPLTFSELQALLIPAAGQAEMAAPGLSSNTNGVPQALNPLMPAGGPLNGVIAGKAGQAGPAGQAAPGITAGLQLSEALAATLGSESGRPADPTSLVASGRFHSALEVAGQQAANAGAAKLTAETAVPLKSYATSIDTPVGHAEWGDKLVGKLSWLTARNMSVAEIHLTPPDMGPMEVKVRVQNEQANITVHTTNPVVREQLEQQSHRLRDMLGDQGLNLARFEVSDSPQQRGGEQGAGEDQGGKPGNHVSNQAVSEVDEADVQAGSLDLSWKGEVDIFA
ncbi:flagellar hook-length control protein FliK [Marinobacter sp. F4218]|uniref:flagellar hook-length control protein FliK n=1 Tax=Marinobacter sp. F4218 TaxID=2862868 RepID=UPI001C62F21C|nr:flagellar hook-length control protein FliK [Marinobacter sp. F4218]MBW7470365.1 flagellar hook-length control protein FliK [Marinobacter sp. F4218]